jgi:hypothetical protein
MSWRSAMWQFVNFTGTAGVWRADAIERAGGWRAASLVEDCELSFRHLFAGYRTKFVKEIVAPAELPATYTAYKAQQRRWTQGWVQLQRIHLTTLLFRYRSTPLRRLALTYHMCISWQWLAWAIWLTVLPLLIHRDLWFGTFGFGVGIMVYALPSTLWLVVATTAASLETKHTYDEPITPLTIARRLRRAIPYLVINTGMLPHQFIAFNEGLFGPLHSEFERTPKTATITSLDAPAARCPSAEASQGGTRQFPAGTRNNAHAVKIHWPYVAAELFFITYQVAWAVVFLRAGLTWCALGAGYLAVCVGYLTYHYGDHAGRVCFVFEPSRSPNSSRPHGRVPVPTDVPAIGTVLPDVIPGAPR